MPGSAIWPPGYDGSTRPPAGTPINLAHPLARGLAICVPFWEAAGVRAEDLSGGEWHAELKKNGGATPTRLWTRANPENGATGFLDSTADSNFHYWRIANRPGRSDARTVLARVCVTAMSSGGTYLPLANKRSGFPEDGGASLAEEYNTGWNFSGGAPTGGGGTVYITTGSSPTTVSATFTSVPQLNRWHTSGFRWLAPKIDAVFDGKVEASATTGTAFGIVTGNNSLHLGDDASFNRWMNGWYDWFMEWDRDLTDEELLSLHYDPYALWRPAARGRSVSFAGPFGVARTGWIYPNGDYTGDTGNPALAWTQPDGSATHFYQKVDDPRNPPSQDPYTDDPQGGGPDYIEAGAGTQTIDFDLSTLSNVGTVQSFDVYGNYSGSGTSFAAKADMQIGGSWVGLQTYAAGTSQAWRGPLNFAGSWTPTQLNGARLRFQKTDAGDGSVRLFELRVKVNYVTAGADTYIDADLATGTLTLGRADPAPYINAALTVGTATLGRTDPAPYIAASLTAAATTSSLTDPDYVIEAVLAAQGTTLGRVLASGQVNAALAAASLAAGTVAAAPYVSPPLAAGAFTLARALPSSLLSGALAAPTVTSIDFVSESLIPADLTAATVTGGNYEEQQLLDADLTAGTTTLGRTQGAGIFGSSLSAAALTLAVVRPTVLIPAGLTAAAATQGRTAGTSLSFGLTALSLTRARATIDLPVVTAPLFLLYEESAQLIIGTAPSTDRLVGLAGRLGQGVWTLGLSYLDGYLNESDHAQIDVEIDAFGNVAIGLAVPSNVQASPDAGGLIELSWQSILKRQQVHPSEFDIADTTDLGTILDTITGTGRASYTASLGPFANGSTAQLAVRGRDVTGRTTSWTAAPPAVADSVGPAPLAFV